MEFSPGRDQPKRLLGTNRDHPASPVSEVLSFPISVREDWQGYSLQAEVRLGFFKSSLQSQVFLNPRLQHRPKDMLPPKPTVNLLVIQCRLRQQRKRPIRGAGLEAPTGESCPHGRMPLASSAPSLLSLVSQHPCLLKA